MAGMGVRHHHQSLAMVGFDDGVRQSLARGDKNNLPLGAVWATPTPPLTTATSTTATTATIKPSHTAASTRATSSNSQQQVDLPQRPAGQPVLVLFPDTLHLAVFLTQPHPLLLVSGLLVVLALASSVLRGWGGFLSPAGGGAGLLAGVTAGLGMRARPVGRWSWMALSSLAVALLGGGRLSVALGCALAISTLWMHGWWLFLQPEIAPLMFFVCGVTMDVALGFLLASLVQRVASLLASSLALAGDGAGASSVHCKSSPGSGVPPTAANPLSQSCIPPGGGDGGGGSGVAGGRVWAAVTPPGLVSRGGGSRN